MASEVALLRSLKHLEIDMRPAVEETKTPNLIGSEWTALRCAIDPFFLARGNGNRINEEESLILQARRSLKSVS